MSPRFEWPQGYRCAAVLSFDVDAESAHVFREPARAAAQLADMEERRFGPRVGVPRILRLLSSYELRATFFVPGYTVVHHTDAVRAIQAAGHELACHGNVHEALDTLDEPREIEVLEEQLRIFQDVLGLRPTGYRAPAWELNLRTPGLLRQHGFLYDSSLMGDDVPYLLQTAHGPLVEVPVHWMLDDAPLFRHVRGAGNAIADPERVLGMWRGEFDALREEGGCFVLTLHPWISGRASRIAVLRELVEHMLAARDVWLTTAEDVARWSAVRRA